MADDRINRVTPLTHTRTFPLALFVSLALIWASLFASDFAKAHPLAPALLEIKALEEGRAEVTWKTSRLRPRGVDIQPILPVECPTVSDGEIEEATQSVTLHWTIDCGSTGLVGKTLRISGLLAAPIDVLVRVQLADDRSVGTVLRGGDDAFVIPERVERSEVFWSYLNLGTEHILTGPDHLLFVLGLLMLMVALRPLIKVVTAFTVGHSVTLTLVALGWARVPSGPVEILIAATVLLLAAELATPEGQRPSLLRRRPWLMAFGFGLIHGMGFAGALAEVGLPDDEIPMALFSFNVGIEIGQIAFVLVMAAIGWAIRQSLREVPPWLARLPAYGIGIMAAYWFFERTASVL
ncbi:MAG: hypothetical protein CL917_08990 [Deltaproteobacteria bacterium]|nr:hypothetical protein [Deltaproteobacteria bacterium]